jgi:hypothetical protein
MKIWNFLLTRSVLLYCIFAHMLSIAIWLSVAYDRNYIECRHDVIVKRPRAKKKYMNTAHGQQIISNLSKQKKS